MSAKHNCATHSGRAFAARAMPRIVMQRISGAAVRVLNISG
jgi:hypothetical protein